MVLQESVSLPDSTRAYAQREEGKLSSVGKVNSAPLVHFYQPPIPYRQRLGWAKPFQLEPKFVRFLDVLKRVYANIPFLEVIKKAPTCLQFLRDFLSKKG